MRVVYKLIIIFISALTSFVIGLAIAGFFLEDKLVQFTIDQLNQRLTASLTVKEVKVSLLKGFPYAAVTLKEVEIIEGSLQTPQEFETGLLSLEEVVVKINLIGVFSNRYDLESLVLKNGWINLYFDNSGKGNFEIFKSSGKEDSGWILDMNRLQFSNVNISYIDPLTGWVSKGYIEQGELKGKINGDAVHLGIKVNGALGELRQGAFLYIRNERFDMSTTFDLNDSLILFHDAEAKLGKAKVHINGSVGRNPGMPVKLSIAGDNLATNNLLMLLSQFNLTLPPKTKTKGHFAFNLNINGITKLDEPFKIDLNFSTKEVVLHFLNRPQLVLSQVAGTFNNGHLGKPESSAIGISSFKMVSNNSMVQGSLQIKNINHPLYHLKVKHSIDFNDFALWDLKVPITRGIIEGDLEALGLLEQPQKITLASFEDSKFKAQTTISNIDFQQVGKIPDLKNIAGEFTVVNQDITKGRVEGLLHQSGFEADFRVANAGSILFGNGKAEVNANIIIDSLNSAIFLETPRDTSAHEGLSAWSRIQSISGDVFVDHFIHQQFSSQPLSATISIKEDELVCNSFLSRSCDGVITGRLGAKSLRDSGYYLNGNVDLDGLNISKFFESFDNFHQSTVTSSNISGEIKGNIIFSSNLNKAGVDFSSIVATSSLTLTDGRLKNVEQLESLSRFIELEELRNIYFSTLKNTISIADQTVTIPQMEVNSSAINLLISGNQKFSGDYRYHIQMRLSDVLFKKALEKNAEFGDVEREGNGVKLFLRLEGDNKSSTVAYDRTKAREAFKETVQEEKKNLKSIIQDEFKFLKRKSDTVESSAKDAVMLERDSVKIESSKETLFTIEWDDE